MRRASLLLAVVIAAVSPTAGFSLFNREPQACAGFGHPSSNATAAISTGKEIDALACGLRLNDGEGEPKLNRAASVATSADAQDFIFLGDGRPILVRIHVTVDRKPFRQVRADYLEKLFKQLDRDDDGFLDKDELDRVPPLATAGFAGVVGAADELKSLAEKTGGKIDREAFFAFYERVAPMFNAGQGRARTRAASALFELLNTDHDGRLSREELLAADTALKCRDFDDDDLITEQELAPGLPPADVAAGNAAVNLPASNLVSVIHPTTKPADIAKTLANYYKRSSGVRLSLASPVPREDFILPADIVKELDSNGDRMLSESELAAFADRKPDIELRFQIGKHLTSDEEDELETKTESSGRFPVRSKSFGTKFLAETGDALLEFEAFQSNPAKNDSDMDVFRFRNYDPDNNGYIDADEAKMSPFMAGSFKAMDADGDGKVFPKEFDAFAAGQKEQMATRLTLEVADQGRQLFDILDTNSDSQLSVRELKAAAGLLDSYDANHDGYLGGNEITRSVKFDLARGTGRTTATRTVVNMTPSRRKPSRRDPDGPLWFRKMDRNHDGEISLREFIGPREEFERLDTNHDGVIDVDEAEAAGKP